VGNTLEFVLMSVPFLVVLPLLLAVLLNTKTPGRNIYRAIYFAPWVLSVSVVGLLWWWIFQSQGGLLNYYLRDLGIRPPRWLSTMPWAWVSILLRQSGGHGLQYDHLSGGPAGYPDVLYEAASD
jgi:multiple sugar transport system permease protein